MILRFAPLQKRTMICFAECGPTKDVAAMSDQTIILWLFTVPIAALLCIAVRTQYRILRGRESGRLHQPNKAEAAAGRRRPGRCFRRAVLS
jgi:hypothetical protein